MRNKKYWRERTLTTERIKIAQLIKDDVYRKIFLPNRINKELGISDRLAKLMVKAGLFSPTRIRLIRRLKRKVRRMENGTYRRRNVG